MTNEKEIRKQRFIQMAQETSKFIKEKYVDFGKFSIVVYDEEPLKAILQNDSEIDKPSFMLYNDFIDRFNQEIYPNYLEFEEICFYYFGNFRGQNKMRAFMTQVLNELRVYAKDISKSLYDNSELNTNDPAQIFENMNKFMIKLESSLYNHLDELIIKYIDKYDRKVTTLSQFKLKYSDTYDYMISMIPKVIEYID